jgi:hypothetical protein
MKRGNAIEKVNGMDPPFLPGYYGLFALADGRTNNYLFRNRADGMDIGLDRRDGWTVNSSSQQV